MLATRRLFLVDSAKLVTGGACLSLVGCSVSSVILDIEIVSTAISVAAPVVAAFGGPGAAVITSYLSAAAVGTQCVLTAAQMPGATSATIAAAIASCLGSVAGGITFPAGTPPNIVAVIQAVANAISHLITTYGSQKLVADAAKHPVPLKLTWQDHRKIGKMEKQLREALSQLPAKK